jgi:hypothetical protein
MLASVKLACSSTVAGLWSGEEWRMTEATRKLHRRDKHLTQLKLHTLLKHKVNKEIWNEVQSFDCS